MPTFGILHDFRRPGGGDYVEYYAECLAEVALADELGLDTVWLSEHHLTSDGMTPAPLAGWRGRSCRCSRRRRVVGRPGGWVRPVVVAQARRRMAWCARNSPC